jgi:hypothetical protein
MLLLDMRSVEFEDPKFVFECMFSSALLISVVFALGATKYFRNLSTESAAYFRCAQGAEVGNGRHQSMCGRAAALFASGVTLCLVPVDYLVSLLYMTLISVLTRGLVCTTPTEDNTAGLLVAAGEIKCFHGVHLAMAPCALLGICCLYPAVVLTRPVSQIYHYISTVTFKEDDTFLKKKYEAGENERASKEAKEGKKINAAFESEQNGLEDEKKNAKSAKEFEKIKKRLIKLQSDRRDALRHEKEDREDRERLAKERLQDEQTETKSMCEIAKKISPEGIQIHGAHYARDLSNVASRQPPRFLRVVVNTEAKEAGSMHQYLFKNLDEHWYIGDTVGDNTEEMKQAKLRSSQEESLTATTFQWEWAKTSVVIDADKWAVAGTPLELRADVKTFKFMFDYNYIFFLAQMQTVLAVVATFFADSVYIVLITSLVADALIVAYFLRKAPCSIPSINTIAVVAYGFSLWINIASLIVTATRNDFIGSIMIFTYVAFVCVITLLISSRIVSMGWLLSVQSKALSVPEQGQIKGGLLDVVRNWNSPDLHERYSTRVAWGFSAALIFISVLWTQSHLSSGTQRGLVALSSTSIAALTGFILFLMLMRDELKLNTRSEAQVQTGAPIFRILCVLLYLSSNCLALLSMMIEEFEGLGGRKTGVMLFYAVLGNDFVALLGLTCWYWCSIGKSFGV